MESMARMNDVSTEAPGAGRGSRRGTPDSPSRRPTHRVWRARPPLASRRSRTRPRRGRRVRRCRPTEDPADRRRRSRPRGRRAARPSGPTRCAGRRWARPVSPSGARRPAGARPPRLPARDAAGRRSVASAPFRPASSSAVCSGWPRRSACPPRRAGSRPAPPRTRPRRWSGCRRPDRGRGRCAARARSRAGPSVPGRGAQARMASARWGAFGGVIAWTSSRRRGRVRARACGPTRRVGAGP